MSYYGGTRSEEFWVDSPLRVGIRSADKYMREIHSCQVEGVSVHVDIYSVLRAFNVTCPARQHAIKKLLMAGGLDAKDENQDLLKARDALDRSIKLLQYDR